MTVAISGAAGLIGQRVVQILRERGCPVVSIGEGVDLRKPQRWADVPSADVVVHLAARSGGVQFQNVPDRSVLEDNMAMLRSALGYADAAGAGRFLFASSAVVYGQTDVHGADESHAVITASDRPSPYAWSKLSGELVVEWWASDPARSGHSMRFGNVYGKGLSTHQSRRTVISDLAIRIQEAAMTGRPLWFTGNPASVRSFVHVDDVAAAVAHLALLESPSYPAYNVDTGEGVTIEAVAKMTMARLGVDAHLVVDEAHGNADIRVTRPVNLAREGWSPKIDLAEGLDRVVPAFAEGTR